MTDKQDIEMNRIDDAYIERMTAFEADCNDGKGEPMACHQVGEFFAVVKDDHKRSAKVYADNCARNNYAPSCFNMGRLHVSGKGVQQDDDEAKRLFGKACDGGHLQGCYHHAILLYLQGKTNCINNKTDADTKANHLTISEKVQKENTAKALKLFDWACKEGERDSCYFAGGHYITKGAIDRNPKKAVEYFTKSCESNHAPSCFNLAVMYNKGDDGVEIDQQMFEKYKDKTNNLVRQYGGLKSTKTA